MTKVRQQVRHDSFVLEKQYKFPGQFKIQVSSTRKKLHLNNDK